MILQAALNGAREAGPFVPLSPARLAADAVECREAGADCLHLHPRDAKGAESLAPDDVAAALTAVRQAVPSMPVGVSTGGWITPARRIDDMRGWVTRPDYASVNLSEVDAPKVIALMGAQGIGVELGLASMADLERALSLDCHGLRAMIEMDRGSLDVAQPLARAMLDRLRESRPGLPVLLHGFDVTAWDFVALARDWGCDARIGIEDVLTTPDGQPATNRAQVMAARAILNRKG